MKMPIIEYRINDIFNDDFADNLSISKDDYLLIIGNPPWVTNTELTKLNSDNRPDRKNIRKLNGLDALTGKSNFDIAESIIYRLISKFNDQIGKVALLCKNTVIKNLIKDQQTKNIGNFKAYKINARKEFGKTCNASLLTFDLGLNKKKSYCEIFNIDNPIKIIRKFGWYKNKFVANLAKYMKIKEFDGSSNFEWRHGIKHDCSKVLILEKDSEQRYHNRLGEIVEIEEKYLYPFLKGSDLKEFEVNTSERKIILTQNKLNEDTNKIKIQASKTWNYLLSNEEYFSKRKSSIFNKKIKFAVFGVGEYIFSPYKIAIASMYKKANFSLVNTINNRPVLFDDTCYFLGFEKYATALFICTVLNSDITNNLLDAIVFRDSKRPYTKEVLMRIDILKILENITFSEIRKIWQDNNYSNTKKYSEKEYKKVKKELSQKTSGN